MSVYNAELEHLVFMFIFEPPELDQGLVWYHNRWTRAIRYEHQLHGSNGA